MILTLLLQAAVAAVPTPADEARFTRCADLAAVDRAAAEAEASAWRLAGGGFLARQCLALGHAAAGRYAGAAAAFEEAARGAELAKDARAASVWALAGNAWLAAGEPAKARVALDAALARGTLTGVALGEAHLDRARAAVAAGDAAAARVDLDRALETAGEDPLAWLLSATLARRGGDLARAARDIAEAVRRSPDDASVQLEAGNVAALAGDEAGARAGWRRAAEIDAAGAVGAAARAALAQFEAGK